MQIAVARVAIELGVPPMLAFAAGDSFAHFGRGSTFWEGSKAKSPKAGTLGGLIKVYFCESHFKGRSDALKREYRMRERLLDEGYARLTMERVAAQAGVSKATICRWWSTKGELALEAAEDEISIGVVPNAGSSKGDLDIAIQQLVDTFSRPLASVVIFAAITTAGDDPAMAQVFRDRHVYPWRKSAAEALERAFERGDTVIDDVQFILDVIVGTVFQRTLVMKEPLVEGLKQKLLRLVLAG